MDISLIKILVAAEDEGGRASFREIDTAWHYIEPEVTEATFLWEFKETPALPGALGGVPADMNFPTIGGSKVGLVCLPPHSAGRMNIANTLSGSDVTLHGDEADLHRSDTVDIEIFISGKVDVVLDGGETRTLGPGSCLVMGGVMHAWRNRYDEPCVFAIFLTGAKPVSHAGD